MYYSVPDEARKVLLDGILSNPAHRDLPSLVNDLASNVVFEGNAAPSMPMNWRFAEAVSALKALEVALANALVETKYLVKTGAVRIDTDRTNLLYMGALLTRVDPDGVNAQVPPALNKFIKDKDYHGVLGSEHRRNATNFYRAKDGRYIYIHGGMKPGITLTALGLPLESEIKGDESIKLFQDVVGQLDSDDLEKRMLEEFKQAASVAYTTEQYKLSEQGKANAGVGLYEVHHVPDASQKPGWWADSPSFPPTPQRPLAGLKVVDLSRVIASPALTRSLAEYGASVMRVTAPHICDYSALHAELNWTVVVDGYRPNVLEKYGFGKDGILKLVKDSRRDRGIIYARVNYFGWNGPWANRPGWQQTSDASTGIAMGFAKAMVLQNGEAVIPLFPTADYCCGLSGSSGVFQALIARNEKRGSYIVDSLNYFNSWLADSCGEYPPDVWADIRQLHNNPVFLPHQNLPGISIRCVQLLIKNAPGRIIRPNWLEDRQSDAIGARVRTIKPVAEWDANSDGSRGVQPGFNVGTRGNGVDVARWPEDLLQEVVAE
ncbi:alpha-methylacyl-CoA racemase [Mycena latifolia]|nr:alpha-methylacyl-CoA racemase [Mycena latifolia]